MRLHVNCIWRKTFLTKTEGQMRVKKFFSCSWSEECGLQGLISLLGCMSSDRTEKRRAVFDVRIDVTCKLFVEGWFSYDILEILFNEASRDGCSQDKHKFATMEGYHAQPLHVFALCHWHLLGFDKIKTFELGWGVNMFLLTLLQRSTRNCIRQGWKILIRTFNSSSYKLSNLCETAGEQFIFCLHNEI